jgi:hypothetical protein
MAKKLGEALSAQIELQVSECALDHINLFTDLCGYINIVVN